MAITGTGISFFPLFWVFNDQWKYYIPNLNGPPSTYNHWGHIHFFMPGYNMTGTGGDAFGGQQRYTFQIQDIWGPNSNDPNQTDLYRVIGTPKWYYHVTELWRRVFVQPWDNGQGRGVKWDASPTGLGAGPFDDVKTMGPFREGMTAHGLFSYAPYWMANCRSLPIDYYTSGAHVQSARQNHLADRARSLLSSDYVDAKYNLQHGNYILAHSQGGSPAGVPPFSDELYIWPVIEYQKVLQLDWEILPGSTPDVASIDDADDTYGDGWQTEITVPFVDPVTKVYRSPFALQPNVVLPFGQYNNLNLGSRLLVPTASRLKHGTASYSDQRPFDARLDMPDSLNGTPVTTWHNPWGDDAEGRVVQQCLGGLVRVQRVRQSQALRQHGQIHSHDARTQHARGPWAG